MDNLIKLDKINKIKSGDLLIWSKDRHSLLSNIFLTIIRLFTLSDFAHVAIAVIENDKLCIVEATTPTIRLVEVKPDDEFYFIPMNVEWKLEYLDFLLNKLGLKYSFMDGVRAYFNKKLEDDNRWQCAELANAFYKLTGSDYKNCFTPTKLVNGILTDKDKTLIKV